jgi:hypothetical protein
MAESRAEWRTLTRDELLLWLNDREGRDLTAGLRLERGDYAVDALAAHGTLRHWRSTSPDISESWLRTGNMREDIEGLYYLVTGDDYASLDVSDVGDVRIFARNVELGPDEEADEVVVELAVDEFGDTRVSLAIIEPSHEPRGASSVS